MRKTILNHANMMRMENQPDDIVGGNDKIYCAVSERCSKLDFDFQRIFLPAAGFLSLANCW
ncbi:MAG: hypothetical protein U9Q75_01305 [Pseudomonadota bacterium]|nr:hypothetical protein [Pseudomonadota bacterium]